MGIEKEIIEMRRRKDESRQYIDPSPETKIAYILSTVQQKKWDVSINSMIKKALKGKLILYPKERIEFPLYFPIDTTIADKVFDYLTPYSKYITHPRELKASKLLYQLNPNLDTPIWLEGLEGKVEQVNLLECFDMYYLLEREVALGLRKELMDELNNSYLSLKTDLAEIGISEHYDLFNDEIFKKLDNSDKLDIMDKIEAYISKSFRITKIIIQHLNPCIDWVGVIHTEPMDKK